jgi:hypothetical protein
MRLVYHAATARRVRRFAYVFATARTAIEVDTERRPV